jgi:hypothetical protein
MYDIRTLPKDLAQKFGRMIGRKTGFHFSSSCSGFYTAGPSPHRCEGAVFFWTYRATRPDAKFAAGRMHFTNPRRSLPQSLIFILSSSPSAAKSSV